MIINGPGFAAERRSEPVSLVDLRPTLLDLAGADGEARDGVSLRDIPVGRPVFGQFQQAEIGLFAVIATEWKYIYSAYDKTEYLLDRRHDVRETANVAYSPRRREPLLIMRALAREHFDDLAATDFDAMTGNVPLRLGERPNPDTGRALRALDLDPEAATLVVRGGPWLSTD